MEDNNAQQVPQLEAGQEEQIDQRQTEILSHVERKPPEQCEYFSQENLHLNFHKTTDLFGHTAHLNYPKTRFPDTDPRHKPCASCYTTHCLYNSCWDPANHAMTLSRHPEFASKERRDKIIIEVRQAEIRSRADVSTQLTRVYLSDDDTSEQSQNSDEDCNMDDDSLEDSNMSSAETVHSCESEDEMKIDGKVTVNVKSSGGKSEPEEGVEIYQAEEHSGYVLPAHAITEAMYGYLNEGQPLIGSISQVHRLSRRCRGRLS